jgi:hypothetical protein
MSRQHDDLDQPGYQVAWAETAHACMPHLLAQDGPTWPIPQARPADRRARWAARLRTVGAGLRTALRGKDRGPMSVSAEVTPTGAAYEFRAFHSGPFLRL